MIWTSTSGTTISSSERPNIVCGNSRLIQLRWRISRFSGAQPAASGMISGAAGLVASATATVIVSLEPKGITGAAHRLQIAWVARVGLDLAAQPGHLHVDIADIAAELHRLRQVLARHRLPGPGRQTGQQPCFAGGEMHDIVAAKQLTADDVEAKQAKADHLVWFGHHSAA